MRCLESPTELLFLPTGKVFNVPLSSKSEILLFHDSFKAQMGPSLSRDAVRYSKLASGGVRSTKHFASVSVMHTLTYLFILLLVATASFITGRRWTTSPQAPLHRKLCFVRRHGWIDPEETENSSEYTTGGLQIQQDIRRSAVQHQQCRLASAVPGTGRFFQTSYNRTATFCILHLPPITLLGMHLPSQLPASVL